MTPRRLLARLRHELTLAAVALQFLTRWPVNFRHYDPDWLHGSARHFPLVGAGVGLLGAVVLAAGLALWPPVVAVLLSLAATVWATGGFHEDGLADTCDGLGGAVGRERALAIMKDSRLGSYGALGLGLTLALKVAVLTAIAQRSGLLAGAALVLAHAWSRGATVALLAALPYGGDLDHAKAKPLAQQVGPGALAAALAWCALLGVAVLWCALPAVSAAWGVRLLPWARALAAVALVATVCARWLMHRLGGYTGDGLGATQQWTELAVYLALAAQP